MGHLKNNKSLMNLANKNLETRFKKDKVKSSIKSKIKLILTERRKILSHEKNPNLT